MSYRHRPDGLRDPSAPPHTCPRRVTIISASVGAGHDGAAEELAARLEVAGFRVDRHDFLDLMPTGLGPLLCGVYRRLLTVAPGGYQRIYAALERSGRPGFALRVLIHCTQRRALRAIAPDAAVVVSTYPGASQVLGSLRRRGRLGVPAFTYLTDFSVHPLWVAPGIDAHLAAHGIPAAQARALGAARVMVTGPMAGPWFAPADAAGRSAARRRTGLPEGVVLALLVAGSWGVGAVRKSAAEIRATGAATPVVVCGRNDVLADRLRADGFEFVRGWEEDMPTLMRACDVLVQNAGGLTSLEAFASGLPVGSYRCIPGHGQTNAAALDTAGLAVWIRNPDELGPALTALAGGPLGQRQRSAGLALYPRGPGPAAVIAAAASGAAPAAAPRPATARTATVLTATGTDAGVGNGADVSAGAGSRGSVPALAKVPTSRPRRSSHRLGAMVTTLSVAVLLGVAAPLASAHAVTAAHVVGVAHNILERYER